MLIHLYKYSVIREDFFSNPMFRVTPLNQLNDPFEGAVTINHIKKEDAHLKEYYNSDENIDDNMIGEMAGLTQDDIDDCGIISLTEDPLNPIMWSHYANEHKGFAIQLDIANSFLVAPFKENNRNQKIKFKDDVFGLISDIPKVVQYSRNRQLFLFHDEITPDKKYHFPHKKLYAKLMFTKANEWMYEKEHRTVLELKNSDVIICDRDEELITYCNNNDINCIPEGKDKIKIEYKVNFELDEECGDECIRFEIYLRTKFLNSLYFYKINPQSIRRIIIGCRVGNDKLENIRTLINNNKELMHCEIYQTKISNEKFELELVKKDNKTE